MDILSNIETEIYLLNELKDLFHFVPPGKLRRSIEDLFFMYLIEKEDPDLPEQKKMFENIYHLLNFLNEVEERVNQALAAGNQNQIKRKSGSNE